MSQRGSRVFQISHVSLRVRDLARSARFYCDLFGLASRPAPGGGRACLCVASDADGLPGFAIALLEGLPLRADPFGLDHVSLQVSAPDVVDQIYRDAIGHGATATLPRLYDGYYQTFIFDPDGYKVEVVAALSSAGEMDERSDVDSFLGFEPPAALTSFGASAIEACMAERTLPPAA